MVPALLEQTFGRCRVVCIKRTNGWLEGSVMSPGVRVPDKAPQLASPSLSLLSASQQRISTADRLG